jgi:hypothetical protein
VRDVLMNEGEKACCGLNIDSERHLVGTRSAFDGRGRDGSGGQGVML